MIKHHEYINELFGAINKCEETQRDHWASLYKVATKLLVSPLEASHWANA